MPAILATSRTFPFATAFSRMAFAIAGVKRTRPSATARREVTDFSETSTMRVRPLLSAWVKEFDKTKRSCRINNLLYHGKNGHSLGAAIRCIGETQTLY